MLSIVGASYVRLDATWYVLWYGKQPCILLWEAIFWGCPHAVRREVEKRHVGLANEGNGQTYAAFLQPNYDEKQQFVDHRS